MSFTEFILTDGEREVMVHVNADGECIGAYVYATDMATFPEHYRFAPPGLNKLFRHVTFPEPKNLLRSFRSQGFVGSTKS